MSNSIEHTVLLKEIDQLQIDLSNKFIKPNVLVFEEYLYHLRTILDTYIDSVNQEMEFSIDLEFKRKIDSNIEQYGKKALLKYPKGACYFITHSLYDTILKEMKERSDLFFLKEFISEGGVFKTIWGQLKGDFFQTAFQLGSYYVDSSNDTVVITKPKIEIAVISESGFKNVDNLFEFKAIKEKYHQLEAYPNVYFPNLAVYLPFFFVIEGKLLLDFNKVIFDLLQKTEFVELENYLNQERDLKELPIKFKEELDLYFNAIRLNKRFEKLVESKPLPKNKDDWKAISFINNFDSTDIQLVKSICRLFNQKRK